MLKKLEIKGLFNKFDYIEFEVLAKPNSIQKPQLQYLEKIISELFEVYLIKEQRLIRKNFNPQIFTYSIPIVEAPSKRYDNTIEEFAAELSNKLKEVFLENSKTSRELDGSFPRRLFEENNSIAEQVFNERYNKIKEKQKALSF